MDARIRPPSDLQARLLRGEAVVAGVLSGTSADGIDVALFRGRPSGSSGEEPRPELLAFETRPFSASLEERVRAVLDGAGLSLGELARLDRDLGLAFGDAVRLVGEAHGRAPELVGSHGQTVWHHDGEGASGPATLQLGDGCFVARAAGAPTVSDFRQADCALGGEGAPVSALVDPLLFAEAPRPVALLNLGGIANLTLLTEEGVLAGFDTGPAGSLLDGLARALLGRGYDEGGRVAGAGRASEALVAETLGHPFFGRPAPKTTGRDTFGAQFVEGVLGRGRALGLGSSDLLASAVEVVARSVLAGLAPFEGDSAWPLVVAGGGVHHLPLGRALARGGRWVRSSGELGVDPDAREALVFGTLAVRFVLGQASPLPPVTGARAGAVLGKFSAP